jgi:hemolysin activation/secretion protein
VGHSFTAVRPTLFYDVGWAGDRDQWRHPGTVGSGAGAGLSILDGMMRVDLARGFQPERQWRLDLYLEARF